jgi:hypothetical protein
MTVAADGKGLLTLNVFEENDDESDALTVALCITRVPKNSAAALAHNSAISRMHAKAATNIQQVNEELAATEKAERDAADERRAKKTKGKVVPPAGADMKPEPVKPVGLEQTSLGLFDQGNEPEALSTNATETVEQATVTVAANDYPD